MAKQPPPLPQLVIDTILSHLIPPTIPLPRQLVAQPLLHRLEFVPPDVHDTDAYLTPVPRSTPVDPSSSLTNRLGSLVDGYESDSPTYAYDGETVFARLSLKSDGLLVVRVIFAYETGLRARGWVYHAAEIPGPDVMSWSDTIPSIPTSQTIHTDTSDDQPDLTAPRGYWEGFTPTITHVDLPPDTERSDDDYWALYGQGQGSGTPHLDVNGGPSRPKTPRLSGSKAPSHPNASAADVRDKVESRIMVILRSLWSAWVSGANGQDEMEEKALSWLRTCREALDGAPARDVLSAKLEVLKDLYETVNGVEDGFWRRLEEVVRMPRASRDTEDTW